MGERLIDKLPSTLKVAIADPPYPGMAKRFYSDDPNCTEVDHGELMARLERDFDAWALCTASTTLREVLSVAPPDIRIAAWVKPFASFKPGVDPAYAWEPVLFRTARVCDREGQTVRDWCACNITLKRGLTGAKPEEMCWWMFELLGCSPADELYDLYPGTGAVTRAWSSWCNRLFAKPPKHIQASLMEDIK